MIRLAPCLQRKERIMIVAIIGLAISISCIVAVAVYLNRKIDALDEAVFRYMKEEHNERVGE